MGETSLPFRAAFQTGSVHRYTTVLPDQSLTCITRTSFVRNCWINGIRLLCCHATIGWCRLPLIFQTIVTGPDVEHESHQGMNR